MSDDIDKTHNPAPDEDDLLRCERCGRPDAYLMGDVVLCRECFHLRGSCCLEFGGDDLWKEREQKSDHR